MAPTKKNEVAKKESFALAVIDTDMLQSIKEEMVGLGQIQFDSVNVPAGGGTSFSLPGDDPDEPEEVKTLTGVIVYHNPVKAYWKEKYTGGSEPPNCSSFDFMHGVDAETGEVNRCDLCPFNEFGSDPDGGSGKACKDSHRLYMLRDGDPMPIIIMAPTMSIKPLRDYLSKRILLRGKRMNQVITEVSLTTDKNSGGIKYSKCVFKKVGDLTPNQIAQSDLMSEFVKSIAMNVSAEDTPLYEAVDDDNAPDFDKPEQLAVPEE